MHAERLHSIFSSILNDEKQNNYTGLINNISSSLAARITQSTPEVAQQVSTSVKQFREKVKDSETNGYSITWRKVIKELGLEILLLEYFAEEVDNAFHDFSLETEIKSELDLLISERNIKIQGINSVVSGFKSVGVELELLEPGEVVFGFSIPSETVSRELKVFHKELSDLEKQLIWLSKALVNDGRGFNIKSISSTDLSVVINVNIDLGEVLLYVIGALQLALWQFKTKERAAMEFDNAPPALKQQMKEWVDGIIAEGVNNVYDQVANLYGKIINKDEYTRNEKSIKGVFHTLAKKIQMGYNLDVNAGEIVEDEDEEIQKQQGLTTREIADNRALANRVNALSDKSAELRISQAQNSEILSLTSQDHIDMDNEEPT